MTIIVVDGLDKTGKTTLARRLAKRLGAFYVRALDPSSKRQLLETRDPNQQAMIVYASLAPKTVMCRKPHILCVFDRYAYSLAYQLAAGARIDLVLEILAKIPRPDVAIIMVNGVSEVEGASEEEVEKWMITLVEVHRPRRVVVIEEKEEAEKVAEKIAEEEEKKAEKKRRKG